MTDDGGLRLESPRGRFGQDGAYVVVSDGKDVAWVTLHGLTRSPSGATVEGLDHAELSALMRLGAPTVSSTSTNAGKDSLRPHRGGGSRRALR